LILLPSTCFSIISFNSLKYHHRTHQSFPTRRSSDLVASAFIVRTMERRSSVVSSRLRSASMVCIGDGLEGFADAGRGEREDPLPVLIGQPLAALDASPDVRQLAPHGLPNDVLGLRDVGEREPIEEPRRQRDEDDDLRGGRNGRVLRLLQHLPNPLAPSERSAAVLVEARAETR